MIVEDCNFKKQEMTADEIGLSFMGKIENIKVVIIELTNCKEIAQEFLDQGVNHVIYFKMDKTKNPSQNKVINAMEKMTRHEKIVTYMTQFAMYFYKCILGLKTMSEAVYTANNTVRSQIVVPDSISVEHIHSSNVKENERLFEKESDDPRKKIEDGEVHEISHFRAPTNIDFVCENPMILKKDNTMENIIDTLRGSNQF